MYVRILAMYEIILHIFCIKLYIITSNSLAFSYYMISIALQKIDTENYTYLYVYNKYIHCSYVCD